MSRLTMAISDPTKGLLLILCWTAFRVHKTFFTSYSLYAPALLTDTRCTHCCTESACVNDRLQHQAADVDTRTLLVKAYAQCLSLFQQWYLLLMLQPEFQHHAIQASLVALTRGACTCTRHSQPKFFTRQRPALQKRQKYRCTAEANKCESPSDAFIMADLVEYWMPISFMLLH